VNDPDQTIIWSRGKELWPRGKETHKPQWSDDSATDEHSAVDLAGGLVNLSFFTDALRRKALVWCLTGLLGLAIGLGLYVKFPPAYHAKASVLLVYNSTEDPAVQVQTEESLAESQAVARLVVQKLKLPQSVTSLQAAYTVTIITDNVLTIDVGAPSAASAVQRAAALATAFLQYRGQYARTQQQQLFVSLDRQYNTARQRLTQLQAQLSQLPPTQTTNAERTQYNNLQTEIGQQQEIMQYTTSTKSSTQTATNTVIKGSYVLNPATALPHSKIKGPILYFAGGLVGGLVIGVGSVILTALLSRRLRRRDDVAAVLGAPVKLSVGPLRPRRWRPSLPRRAARRRLDMRRVVAYLRGSVPGSSRGPASLAVVAVDDVQVVAQVVASLAFSCVAEGKQVVVADLSSGAHLGRLLRNDSPGIHDVSQDGSHLVLVIPEEEDVAPAGPVPSGASPAVTAQANAALVAACSAADLLLTLATLDPATGGEYLGTWAADAVAVVTAGESTVEKIYSVREMLRLAGTRLDSAVLVGADKGDESLGAVDPVEQSALVS
jgi:capsular polysaccharide biosynthesis protein